MVNKALRETICKEYKKSVDGLDFKSKKIYLISIFTKKNCAFANVK